MLPVNEKPSTWRIFGQVIGPQRPEICRSHAQSAYQPCELTTCLQVRAWQFWRYIAVDAALTSGHCWPLSICHLYGASADEVPSNQ